MMDAFDFTQVFAKNAKPVPRIKIASALCVPTRYSDVRCAAPIAFRCTRAPRDHPNKHPRPVLISSIQVSLVMATFRSVLPSLRKNALQ